YLAIERKCASDGCRVTAKMTLPKAVGQNNSLLRIRQAVFPGKESAVGGVDAQNRQSSIGHVKALHLFGLRAPGYAVSRAVVHSDVFERFVLVAVDQIQELRHVEFRNVHSGSFIPNANETVGVRI